MSPEEKIEAAQKLIDEARAEIAAKKRSWPEKIEAGMCFGEEDGDKSMWIVCDDLQLVCVSSYKAGIRWGGWRETKTRLRYLGRDLIKIADDAHEPTGAELVGKYCEYCDIDGDWDDWRKGECKDFTPGTDQPYLRDQGGRFRFARLAR